MQRKLIIFLLIGFLLSGCATIMHGSVQRIPVRSQPSGAKVSVNRIVVTTPGVITLPRSEGEYIVRFEKAGYSPVEVTLIRTNSGWIWGNVLLGGIIGVIVDYSTGAAYKLTPKEIDVTLNSLGYDAYDRRGVATTDRVVAVDTQPTIVTEAEYYKLLHNIISQSLVKPIDSGSGVVNVAFTLSSDGNLESVSVLNGSTDDVALRGAVVMAIKKSAPFPAFPDDIEGLEKTFTITIEFR